MPMRLVSGSKDFEAQFARLMVPRAQSAPHNLRASVARILADVESEGEPALNRYAQKWDRIAPEARRVSARELAAAERAIAPDLRAALDKAAKRIEAFHARVVPKDLAVTDRLGTRMRQRWHAVDAAGLYVPGGRANYPSTVLMNAIPAKLAGVPRLVMASPISAATHPLVLAAAKRCGITEIYRMGGAHAIAALAFGAGAIAPVDMIVGPGNAYVTEAKRQLFGRVGIDLLAGPSEVVIVADADAEPRLLAADLLSQAEHDAAARPILLTASAALADKVAEELEEALHDLPTRKVAAASWAHEGALVLLRSLAEAPALVNRLAPEHVQLVGRKAEALADKIRHAGAIFLGRQTPEAIGDYIAGPTHVLPTGRAARYASGLSVASFMKRQHVVRCTARGFAALAPAAAALADAEALPAHARALRWRLGNRRS